jgi:predicted metal-dependent hydrolase
LRPALAALQLAFLFDAGTGPAGCAQSASGNVAAPLRSDLVSHISSGGAPVTVFVRHPRARRYLIRLVDESTVRVTIPRWGSKKEAAAFAERERSWIDKQRRRLKDERARRAALAGDDHAITTAGPNGHHPSERDLIEVAKRELPPRVNQLADTYGLAVSRVSIRNQRWRWGSCSRAGRICLNWRLVTMPEWVRDYVIIHELMHLKRMDHSPRFWKLVADACPAYQLARRYLREHAMALVPNGPNR